MLLRVVIGCSVLFRFRFVRCTDIMFARRVRVTACEKSEAKRATDHIFNADVTCEHGIMTHRVKENLLIVLTMFVAAVFGK